MNSSKLTHITVENNFTYIVKKHYKQWLNQCLNKVLLPFIGIFLFIMVWSMGANQINTSLGKFPQPQQVLEQSSQLWEEYKNEKQKEVEFLERQEKRIAKKIAADKNYVPHYRSYIGAPTFFDQIITSLLTVLTGFLISSIIAIPAGIIIGLSPAINNASNPIIQLLKPISPLAWLPLVTMIVSAVYTSDDPTISKSFITSFITVTLCSLWPTLINTSLGVSTVSQDLLNVSKVLRLNPLVHIQKIVLPFAIPMIFTGLRLSLGIAWMVLIAAEMLSQNPGLGKFVWDEFQNGSSSSLSRIMVAVITIGIIGFCLDRIMLMLQTFFSWDKTSIN